VFNQDYDSLRSSQSKYHIGFDEEESESHDRDPNQQFDSEKLREELREATGTRPCK